MHLKVQREDCFISMHHAHWLPDVLLWATQKSLLVPYGWEKVAAANLKIQVRPNTNKVVPSWRLHDTV